MEQWLVDCTLVILVVFKLTPTQQLTEDELTQLDDLYQLLVPTRISNAEYVTGAALQCRCLSCFSLSSKLPARS